ncbi:MAG: ABC transporter ATP-binding protein [Bacteroidetes bacterium]|nr:ABC transporter ATP-binding protein [Bacteroidota bacterium]
MKPILEIQNISKKFSIQHNNLPYLSLRDSVKTIFSNSKNKEEFWALKNVSFNVMPGDTVGIIGKNGAGKSTLLKILSKITPPTTGKIIGRGRIASLLEVGTGFHPELSGRENIFMNGSILGMKRSEINKNFDAIVDFAGVEKFINEPLKHYSSGMQLRLAFAVAAFLENEVLIIDEVLAVGDAEFQKKCMTKMSDVSKSGRTILFVSHNMASIKQLCNKGVQLQNGELIYNSTITKTIENYLSTAIKTSIDGMIPKNASSINTGDLKFTMFLLINDIEEPIDTVNYLAPICLYFEIESLIEVVDCFMDVRINTIDGIEVTHSTNKYNASNNINLKKGINSIKCKIKNSLQPGKYSFTIGIHLANGATLDYVENILDFNINNLSNKDKGDYIYNFKLGIVRFESEWETKSIEFGNKIK